MLQGEEKATKRKEETAAMRLEKIP